jgi:hypothetical protein
MVAIRARTVLRPSAAILALGTGRGGDIYVSEGVQSRI